MMSPEDEILFTCIHMDFSAAQRDKIVALCRVQPIRWEIVYAVAELHGVAPLVYNNLRELVGQAFDVPIKTVDKFERGYFYNIAAKEKIAERIGAVLTTLNAAGLDTMLVKGAALDVLVYAHPWYTTANDVDLLFRLRQDEMPDRSAVHFLDQFRDIHFEYDFFKHHDVTMNDILSVDFERVWADATRIQFRGQQVWVMSPEDLLITACINSCRKRFFRLKSLRDISEILNHYQDIRWDHVADKARAYRCSAIVYAALVVTQQTMGLELLPQTLDLFGVPAARAALIRSLSRNLSATSLEKLYSGKKVFGREVGRGLLLPYAALTPQQVWRRMRFASGTRFRRKLESAGQFQ